VCGSDMHYFTAGRIGPQAVEFPQILGHECAATVEETGPEVQTLSPGQLVAVDPLVACGECDQCRAGRRHTCRRQKFLGSPGQLPGALTEYIVLPADCCFPVPPSLDESQAALVEPLSVGVYAAWMAALEPGALVGVLGAGPIGLCTLLAIHAQIPATVFVTDLVEERLAMARRLGAAWTGNPQELDVAPAIRSLAPLGLDAVFECAGEQDALDTGLMLLKPGGALLVVGIPEADRVSFDASLMRRNELRILNVRRQNHCIEPAIELLATGRIDARPLITHHFLLADALRAFALVKSRRDGVVKALIHCA